jgi:para-nitrobenzyl esterase
MHCRPGAVALAFVLASLGSIAAPAAVPVPAAGQAGAAGLQGPVVRTRAGLVAGLQEGQLAEFRGIPYAAPPIGRLRWQPPAPVRAWQRPRAAQAFAARCMQRPLFDDMVFRSPGPSEDCLYLNVWTSAPVQAGGRPPARHAAMPVLVYIHGGGFVAGDGSELRYDGAALARDGIVTVTLNHRLGAFGFLAHPLLRDSGGASGNYGLMDLVAALHWVQANIAAFGGDPRRVTIAGESAGSIAVSALMVAPSARGLFAGAIGESGSVLGTLPAVPRNECEQVGAKVVSAAGVASAAALRSLPAEAVMAASDAAKIGEYNPCIDGRFLREDPQATFRAGRAARVPLLAGYNSQEGDYDALFDGQAPGVAAYREALHKVFGPMAADALAVYPGDTLPQALESARRLEGDRFIAHSTWLWAHLHAGQGAATWLYHFGRARPAMRGGGPAAQRLLPEGAVHSGEIEYALGNLDTNVVYAWEPQDAQLSATMRHYFAQFMRNGNPNGTGLPEWPGFASGQRLALDVDTHAEPDADAARQEFLERWIAGGGVL